MNQTLWWIARAGWLLGYGGLLALWLAHGQWPWAELTGVLGIVALGTSSRRWSWPASVNLFMLLTVSGFAAALASLWALICVLFGLSAWDMELFVRRLERFPEIPAGLVRRHLYQLSVICALSGAAGALALGVRLSLSFWWAFALAAGFVIAFVLFLRQGIERE